jgi:hypothetical protein
MPLASRISVSALAIGCALLMSVSSGTGYAAHSAQPPTKLNRYLSGVTSTDGQHAWAVGHVGDGTTRVLIFAWNGANWSSAQGENPGGAGKNELYGIAADSTTDVWAVGKYSLAGANTSETLTEHWDGHTWRSVPAPCPGGESGNCALYGVTVLSRSDAWAVGQDNAGVLVEHWDGDGWELVPAYGSHRHYASLNSVSAGSSANIWAVGSLPREGEFAPLIEHWDGTQWAVVPGPAGQGSGAALSGVATVTARHVWAVGFDAESGPGSTLAERWNGAAWETETSSDPREIANFFQSIGGTPTVRVFAVGYGLGRSRAHAIIEHWSGTRWINVPLRLPGSSTLLGVTVSAPTTGWAVGNFSRTGITSPLIMRWSGVGDGWHIERL